MAATAWIPGVAMIAGSVNGCVRTAVCWMPTFANVPAPKDGRVRLAKNATGQISDWIMEFAIPNKIASATLITMEMIVEFSASLPKHALRKVFAPATEFVSVWKARLVPVASATLLIVQQHQQ